MLPVGDKPLFSSSEWGVCVPKKRCAPFISQVQKHICQSQSIPLMAGDYVIVFGGGAPPWRSISYRGIECEHF